MSFLGRLFGTEKAMTVAAESVRDGLDALIYTDEERAQAAAACWFRAELQALGLPRWRVELLYRAVLAWGT